MSKPLSSYTRLDLSGPAPGTLVKNTVRMTIYWLCVTLLLWPSLHPPAEWHSLTIMYFLIASSLIVPALGYASLLARRYYTNSAHPFGNDMPRSFVETVAHTGLIAFELLMAVLTGVTLERLLF